MVKDFLKLPRGFWTAAGQQICLASEVGRHELGLDPTQLQLSRWCQFIHRLCRLTLAELDHGANLWQPQVVYDRVDRIARSKSISQFSGLRRIPYEGQREGSRPRCRPPAARVP